MTVAIGDIFEAAEKWEAGKEPNPEHIQKAFSRAENAHHMILSKPELTKEHHPDDSTTYLYAARVIKFIEFEGGEVL